MRLSMSELVLLLVAGLSAATGAEGEPAAPGGAAGKTEIQVFDVVIVSTNRVMVGTNAMSLAAATNLMAVHRDALDVVAVHGPVTRDASIDDKSSVVGKIASIGVPLVLVEKDGEYAWRDLSGPDGVRTVRIGTDQFTALRRLLQGGKAGATSPAVPVLETMVDWDTATGTYELSRIELGLLGRRVWLVHQQRDANDESGSVGIQLKREW